MRHKIFLVLSGGLLAVALLARVAWPKSEPDNAKVYFERGHRELTQGHFAGGWLDSLKSSLDENTEGANIIDPEKAIQDFNRVIQLEPANASAYRDRGRAEGMQGELEKALADFDRAIELDPRDILAFNWLADLCKSKGKVAGALNAYDRGIKLNPKDAGLYRQRAMLKEKSGDFCGMLSDMESEACVTTNALGAAQVRAGYQLNQFHFAGSKKFAKKFVGRYDRVIRDHPDFYSAYFHRGVFKHLAGDTPGALSDFKQCLGFPDNRLKDYAAIHLWLVGTGSRDEKQADEALSSFIQARAWGETNDWEVRIARFLLGELDEKQFSAGIQTNDSGWQQSQFWFYAAMKYLRAGDRERAVEYFLNSRATETRPYEVAMTSQIELGMLEPYLRTPTNSPPVK